MLGMGQPKLGPLMVKQAGKEARSGRISWKGRGNLTPGKCDPERAPLSSLVPAKVSYGDSAGARSGPQLPRPIFRCPSQLFT